jgi:dCTP deaminase
MLQNDKQILELCVKEDLIRPYTMQTKEINGNKVISFGLSSYGYDLRLSSTELLLINNSATLLDPKNSREDDFISLVQDFDSTGAYWKVPPNSCVLGTTLECIRMPENITAIATGKSTYARNGIIANVTPIEAGWCGHITIELSNTSSKIVKVYANEGIIQLLFFKGDKCQTSYADRKGKYQNQAEKVVLST